MQDFVDFYYGFTSLFMWMTLIILYAKRYDRKQAIKREFEQEIRELQSKRKTSS